MSATKTKQVRWACPNDLHPGVLGPTRPRKDNTCRYCLACSEKSGKLVLRVAPALEKKREVRTQTLKQRNERRLTKLQEKEAARYTVGERDMRDVLKRALTLPAFKSAKGVQLKVRRIGHAGLGGRAYCWWGEGGNKIILTLSNHPLKMNAELESVGVCLHELSHIACWREGKPYGDADTAFAHKCEEGMNQWNKKYNDHIDHEMSGAYRGKIGRRNKKAGRRSYASDDAKAPNAEASSLQQQWIAAVKHRADQLAEGEIRELDLANPGVVLKVPPSVWTEFQHLVLDCVEPEDARYGMVKWVEENSEGHKIRLPKDNKIRSQLVTELSHAVDFHSERSVTRAHALMWAKATTPKKITQEAS